MDWFINNQKNSYGERWLNTMESCFPSAYKVLPTENNSKVLLNKNFKRDRVAILISGGGSCGPWIPGFVAEGLADACVIGSPFSAPSAYTIYEASKHIGQKGVLLLYNNFMGDVLNNDMAAELLRLEGYDVELFPCFDDMGSALGEPRDNRAGRCAFPYLLKIANKLSNMGKTVYEISEVLQATMQRISTLSVYIDRESKIASFGDGFSGEPGFKTIQDATPKAVATELVSLLSNDISPQANEKIFVLLNRLRMTDYADGYNMAWHIRAEIEKSYPIEQLRVGQYNNILDVYGFTLTILCADKTIAQYLEDTVYTDCFAI